MIDLLSVFRLGEALNANSSTLPERDASPVRITHCHAGVRSYRADNFKRTRKHRTMTKFLISFPSIAMNVPAEEMAAVGEASRAVIRDAKAAGVYVFGGGINSEAASVMVAADGSCTRKTYPQTAQFDGGFCVLELPARADAVEWAARLAAACRCAQELREFYFDPES